MSKMASHEPFGHLQPKLWAKKGQQFDSWPLKVGNRPESDVCRRSTAWLWKALKESYKISLDLILIQGLSKKLLMPKVLGVQIGTVLGLLLESPLEKKPFGCSLCGELQRILYGGRWWLPPNLGRGESSESSVARGLS
jgi:hypothetical protein